MLLRNNLLLIFLLIPTLAWSGVDFDATDDWIPCGDNEIITRNFSISFWLNPDDISTSGAQFDTIAKYEATGSERGWRASVNPTAGNTYIGFSVGTSGGTDFDYCRAVDDPLTNILTNGGWSHILFTRSGTSCAIYVDGVSQTVDLSTLLDEDLPNVATEITIGSRTSSSAAFQPTDGQLTEIAIWNTSLAQADATLLASSRIKRIPLQVSPSNLVAYYPLDDEEDGTSADGDTFIDMSSNGNNGTGDDGANNTGLTAKAEEILSYP